MNGNVNSPFEIGWEAVKANAFPIVVLWALAAVMVGVYYLAPQVAGALEPIAQLQTAYGRMSAFVSCAVFCGAIPYIVYVFHRASRPERPLFTAVAQAVWCGGCGIACNWFFGVQEHWFGAGHDIVTVVSKMVVDQFVWTVLVIAPANAAFYVILGRGFLLSGRTVSFRDFVRRAYLPNLIMNWFVGIPSNLAVYSFPRALQIFVLGLLSSAWAVICVGIGRRF
jgi:hypothetical protein